MHHPVLEILVIQAPEATTTADGTSVGVAPTADAAQLTAATPPVATEPAPRARAPIPGAVISVWGDSWTFCKATAKSLSWHHWVPWLGAVSALLSALAATAVFTNLQENLVSTQAKVLVGTVAVLAALITALQTWTSSRIKALTEQMKKFDELHYEIQRDIEHSTRQRDEKDYVCLDDDYANKIRDKYLGVVAGMTQVSNRFWDDAKPDVTRQMEDELRRFGLLDPGKGQPSS